MRHASSKDRAQVPVNALLIFRGIRRICEHSRLINHHHDPRISWARVYIRHSVATHRLQTVIKQGIDLGEQISRLRVGACPLFEDLFVGFLLDSAFQVDTIHFDATRLNLRSHPYGDTTKYTALPGTSHAND